MYFLMRHSTHILMKMFLLCEYDIYILYINIYIYIYLLYATREPPKMAQFDWCAISGYWAISHMHKNLYKGQKNAYS